MNMSKMVKQVKQKHEYRNGELQHLVIRKMNYVAGTQMKPEVQIFMQTNKRFKPLNTELFKKDQIVWMKWSGGPIVAKAKISSWDSGYIKNGNIYEARNLTKGTNLYHLEDYWKSVRKKKNAYYVVVKLHDEEWLEELIYPEARSLGTSWLYIDSQRKYDGWINSIKQDPKLITPSRSLPSGLRFKILRRDSYTCQYCGRSAPKVELHVDHKIPWSVVKRHEESNLVTACADCNLGKSNRY